MDNLFDNFSIDELKKTHVDLMNLKALSWNFSRGAKTTRDYLYENGNVAVRVSYTYQYAEEGRSILQPTRKIQFFDDQGLVGFEQDITKELNVKQLRRLNRELRQGRWDYMDDAAENLPQFAPFLPEPFKSDFVRASQALPILHKYYEREIKSYIEDGTIDFENAIRNETNPIMLELLELNVRPPDADYVAGLTVYQTLLHQLTGEYNP